MCPAGGAKFGKDPKKNGTSVSQIWGWSAQAKKHPLAQKKDHQAHLKTP